ncbi:MAG TPA: hypothetical protein VGQ21_20995 [Thermoanaerobaculia bacterium]|nr:hypothetical protein [Thermoanaerobaculia bacterium]
MRFPCFILLAVVVAAVAYGADSTLGTPSVTPTAAGPYGARIVPLGDGFLALWEEGEQCLYEELHGIRLDRDGQPRDKRDFIVVPATSSIVIIASESDGGDVFIAWVRAFDHGIHLTRVSADTVTVLSDSVPTPSRSIMRVSNGNILFVGVGEHLGDPLSATLLDRTGAVVRSGVKLVEQTASITGMDLVAVNGAFLITWMSSDSHLRVARIAPADVAANDVRITPADLGARDYVYSIRLVSDGEHAMVFWVDYEGVKYGLRARSLSSSGELLGAGTLTIGSVTPSGSPLAPLAVSDGYDVLFQEVVNNVGQIVFVRVSFDGTLQSVSRPAHQQIAATQNGSRTMAVWTESRFSMRDFYNSAAGYEVVTAPLAGDGSVGVGTVVSLDSSVQHVRKLVPFGGGVVALWTEGLPNDRLVVSRLTASGQPADGGLRLRESLFHQSHSAIATDGERLFVVWMEGDEDKPQTLYGAIVSPGALSASVKALASDASGESDIAVVWNGQTFAVVYQRIRTGGRDFAALRIDRAGNAVDPIPIALTPTAYYDENPRLSWNGSDYLLVWQRWYDPFIYFGEQCFPRPSPFPAELFAQRFSSAFAPTGAEIPLATTNNTNTVALNAQRVDVSFAGGLWLVFWFDKAAFEPRFARIDASGARLDPLNGRTLLGSYDDPLLVSAPDGWTIAAHEGYGTYGPGRGLALAHISINGFVTVLDTNQLSGASAVEAFVLTPSPLVAYKRASSSAAFVAPLLQRSRAVHH